MFEMKRSEKDNQFYWHLRSSGNQEILCVSEGYTTKEKCLEGIEAAKKEAARTDQVADHTDKNLQGQAVIIDLKARELLKAIQPPRA